MVDIEDLHFVSEDPEAEDIGDFSVLIAMSADELEALPEWEEAMLRTGRDVRPAGAGDHAAAGEGAGRAVFGAEHAMLEGADRTADRLLGADVYDAAGDHVGSIDDVVLGDDDAVQGVIVDVGGFLGIGAHTVSLPIEDARIGWSDDDVRVQVAMTAEELGEMPEHEG
ncbi:MAG: PRC-barrel domain containing protein [Rhodobacteraceae bacterium]|nr:MAG: PRC-barrel domain containing protein [Paracoccaceae bacterium]